MIFLLISVTLQAFSFYLLAFIFKSGLEVLIDHTHLLLVRLFHLLLHLQSCLFKLLDIFIFDFSFLFSYLPLKFLPLHVKSGLELLLEFFFNELDLVQVELSHECLNFIIELGLKLLEHIKSCAPFDLLYILWSQQLSDSII